MSADRLLPLSELPRVVSDCVVLAAIFFHRPGVGCFPLVPSERRGRSAPRDLGRRGGWRLLATTEYSEATPNDGPCQGLNASQRVSTHFLSTRLRLETRLVATQLHDAGKTTFARNYYKSHGYYLRRSRLCLTLPLAEPSTIAQPPGSPRTGAVNGVSVLVTDTIDVGRDPRVGRGSGCRRRTGSRWPA